MLKKIGKKVLIMLLIIYLMYIQFVTKVSALQSMQKDDNKYIPNENHTLKKDIDSFMENNNFIELKEAFQETSWSSNKAAEADVIYINKKFMVNI